MLEIRKAIETGRLVVVVMTRLVLLLHLLRRGGTLRFQWERQTCGNPWEAKWERRVNLGAFLARIE